MRTFKYRHSGGILLGLLTLLAGGCSKSGGPGQRPPASVTVMHPEEREVTDWEDYAGRLQSPQSTTIQARISGVITDTPFKEGALVHKGDVLFVIDEQPFKADLDNKKATVAKDEAQVDLTQAQLARSQRLLQTHVVDQQDYDIAQANFLQAKAQLEADKAAQETSALNFQWTHVQAPIDGLVSKINVTVGNPGHGRRGQWNVADHAGFDRSSLLLRADAGADAAESAGGAAQERGVRAGRANSMRDPIGERDQFPPQGLCRLHRQQR